MKCNICHGTGQTNGGKNAVIALIDGAQRGVQESFAELKRIYHPLLESLVTRHSLPDMTVQDLEDMRQEALIIFCNSICNYRIDPDGVEFGLYAKICIQNGLASFVRLYIRRRQRTVMPLEFASMDRKNAQTDPLQALVDKENASDLVRTIKKNLSDYENRVWWLYVSGHSVSDIAQKIGANDSKSVSNAIYRIRKKLRTHISNRN